MKATFCIPAHDRGRGLALCTIASGRLKAWFVLDGWPLPIRRTFGGNR